MAGVPADVKASWGQFLLDDRKYPTNGIGVQPQARFQGRVIFGDPSKNDDDLFSADILSDFSGGGQIENRNEGSDQGRFWWATLHTRDPNALSLAREVVAVPNPASASGDAFPLGDINDTMFVVYDADIHAWDETTDAMEETATDTLDDQPVGDAIFFGGVLWIPQGVAGYQTFDGATAAAQVTTITPVAFVEYDNRLFALSTDGRVSEWDGATWTTVLTMDARHTPRHLLVYYNRAGDETIHVVTSRGLYSLDVVNGTIYSTDLLLPPHPDVGLGACLWAGGGLGVAGSDTSTTMTGDLFVSTAVLTYRYSLGATNAPIGPQRDDGLPIEYRGRIVSLAAEHNGLYALIEGQDIVNPADQDAQVEAMAQGADQFYSGATTAYSALMVFNGIGWHTAWTSTDAASSPTRLMVSASESHYRLWWGFGGRMHTIDLPRDFHRPRQGLVAGLDRFQSGGFLETAWFDAQMEGFRKLASHLTVNVPRCTNGVATISVKYATDFSTSWADLGDVIMDPGKRQRSFGFAGVDFQRIRFRVEMSSTDPSDSPLIDSLVLHYIKIPHSAGAWTISVPLFFEGEWLGRTAGQMKADLDALLSSTSFYKLTLGDLDYRVRLAGMTGNDATGLDERGVRTLTLVEATDEADQILGAA